MRRTHATVRARSRALGSIAACAFLAGVAAAVALTGDTAQAVTQAVPKNTAEPSISGNTRVGSTLSASRGTWSGSPTSYAYQWVRCDSSGGQPDGSDCAAIGGATTSKYALAQAD